MILSGRHDMVAVSFDLVKIGDRIIDPFFNANTPADIQTVRAVLAPTST
jgi:hypothetical protein